MLKIQNLVISLTILSFDFAEILHTTYRTNLIHLCENFDLIQKFCRYLENWDLSQFIDADPNMQLDFTY